MDRIEEIHHDPTVLEKSVFAVTAVFFIFRELRSLFGYCQGEDSFK